MPNRKATPKPKPEQVLSPESYVAMATAAFEGGKQIAEALALLVPPDEQVTRFTLDRPPARLRGMRRAQQKPIIQRANALIESGMSAHDALTSALS